MKSEEEEREKKKGQKENPIPEQSLPCVPKQIQKWGKRRKRREKKAIQTTDTGDFQASLRGEKEKREKKRGRKKKRICPPYVLTTIVLTMIQGEIPGGGKEGKKGKKGGKEKRGAKDIFAILFLTHLHDFDGMV